MKARAPFAGGPHSPEILEVTPMTISVAGGPISVRGRWFKDGTEVRVGGVSATLVVVVSSTLLTCIAPVLAVGFHVLEVAGVSGPTMEYTL